VPARDADHGHAAGFPGLDPGDSIDGHRSIVDAPMSPGNRRRRGLANRSAVAEAGRDG
jgi:hypothetical protein